LNGKKVSQINFGGVRGFGEEGTKIGVGCEGCGGEMVEVWLGKWALRLKNATAKKLLGNSHSLFWTWEPHSDAKSRQLFLHIGHDITQRTFIKAHESIQNSSFMLTTPFPSTLLYSPQIL